MEGSILVGRPNSYARLKDFASHESLSSKSLLSPFFFLLPSAISFLLPPKSYQVLFFYLPDCIGGHRYTEILNKY